MQPKDKLTEQQARAKIFLLWETGYLPANFTEDHSEYGRALYQVMKLGHIVWSDFFSEPARPRPTPPPVSKDPVRLN